jgi:hypothetical protein
MTKFLALIEVLSQTDGGAPTHPIAPGGPPPVVGWTPPGYQPSHPIAPGGPPPVAGWTPPGYQPSHPIAPGGLPPGIWGGAPPYPDIGFPGAQPGPSHPIVIPPDAIAPGIPSHPIYWPIAPSHPIAPGEPHPEHPIIIPGDDPENPKFVIKAAWTPQTGWVIVIVPTGIDVPTPSSTA